MKAIFFLAAGMLIAAIAPGQNHQLNSIKVTPPAFIGNASNSINEFLQSNVEYPMESHQARPEGTEVVQFIVSKDGKLSGFNVINSVSPEIDDEVIRLLKYTEINWLPGTKNGEQVAMETEDSLAFKIKPSSDFVEMAQWNMKKGNELCFEKNQPKRALKYFNQAFNYLPNHDAITSVRGLCKYLMGDLDGAGKDWERANILAQRNGENVDKEQVAIDASSINKARQLMLYVKK